MTSCVKCDAEIVQAGWFWVLVSEENTGRASFCPAGGIHEAPEDDDEEL